MAMLMIVVVIPSPSAPVDFDTIATIMLVVLAAGVGWFLWRRK